MHIRIERGVIRFHPSEGLSRFNRSLVHIHRELGHAYQLLVQQGFEGEKSPGGVPWKPLAPRTVKRRKSAHPILRVSGRLARTHLAVGESGAVVGSNLDYAAIHQYGGIIVRKGGDLKLHLRKIKRGARKGRVLFSKSGQASYGMKVNIKPYRISIPARPWLYSTDGSIPESWRGRLRDIVIKHLRRANADID